MKNYYICYYFLLQCFFETLEDDLGELLGKMHCEDDTGKAEQDITEKWKNVIDYDHMEPRRIAEAVAEALENSSGCFEKTVGFIRKMDDCGYYISQARERAEEALNEQS